MWRQRKAVARILAVIAAGPAFLSLMGTSAPMRQPQEYPSRLGGGTRKALVIGNGTYPLARLRNPLNDASDLASSLNRLGFTTTEVFDASLDQLGTSIQLFLSTVLPGDTVFVYFAGHGIQIDGENYLIPIDFRAQTQQAAKTGAYPVTRLAIRLAASEADVVVFVLDACRDNPFSAGLKRVSSAGRYGTAGLAAMEISAAPTVGTTAGMLIQFATGSGQTADDNLRGRNGLFASQLLGALELPGLTLEEIFALVRQRVHDQSRGRQVPLTVSSMVRPVYLVQPEERGQGGPTKSTPEVSADRVPGLTCDDGPCLKGSFLPAVADVVEPSQALLQANAQMVPGGAGMREMEARLRGVVDGYVKAYAALDIRALERLFSNMPEPQKATVRNERRACRSYDARVESTQILKSTWTSGLIRAETVYTCRSKANDVVQIREKTEFFNLSGTRAGWRIDTVDSLEHRWPHTPH